jgi:hypothetical protein
MSWKKSRFASSLMSLFGETAPDASHASRLKEARQAMLDCLVGFDPSEELTYLLNRVQYAPDLQSLWYLRSDMMQLLAGHVGERIAKARIQYVTTLFCAFLPVAQRPRAARLAR